MFPGWAKQGCLIGQQIGQLIELLTRELWFWRLGTSSGSSGSIARLLILQNLSKWWLPGRWRSYPSTKNHSPRPLVFGVSVRLLMHGWGVIFDEASASSVRREKVQSFGVVWFMCKICIGTSARPPQHARMPGEAGFTRKRWTLGRNVAIFSMIWGRMIFRRHQPSYSQLMSTGCPITETKRIVFRFHYMGMNF